jgi:RNA polymerase sigma-70 factor, ECF subfamily
MRDHVPCGYAQEANLHLNSSHHKITEIWPSVYADLVRYATYLLGGDTHAAEDIVQELAIRLWRRPEMLFEDRPLAGWLRTVTRNLVVDLVRRRRARPTEVVLTSGIDYAHPDEFDQIDAADSVTSILAGLSPLHRVVILEVYVRDRAVAEVASDLGIPIGTVKSRCHSAIRQLRAMLGALPSNRATLNGQTIHTPGSTVEPDQDDAVAGYDGVSPASAAVTNDWARYADAPNPADERGLRLEN